MTFKLLFSSLIALLAATGAQAAFILPSWTRPANDAQALADKTTYQHWDLFQSTTSNAPDVAPEVNPNGLANAFDSAAPGSGSFITGNIYSFSGVIKPRAVVPGYNVSGNTLTVLAQLQSWGNAIDTGDIKVNGVDATTLPGYSYTALSSTNDPQGLIVQHAWTFQVPDAASIQIDWGWGVTSSSFTELIVDTRSVPEPAGLGVALLAGAGILFRRNR